MHNTQEKASGRRIKIFSSLEKAGQAVPPGSLRKLKVGNLSLCLAHTEQGWYAIQNACPHQGGDLSRGRLNSQLQVICPLHQYAYHLQSGAEGGGRSRPVATYRVQEEAEGLYLYLP